MMKAPTLLAALTFAVVVTFSSVSLDAAAQENVQIPAVAASTAARTSSTEIRIATLPPTPKSVINALLLSASVPLTVDKSCHQVGTDVSDATLGEYLSGFLAELGDPDSRNYLQVEIVPAEPEETAQGWNARVMIGQSYEEVIWRWGVEFRINGQGIVEPSSYRCLGAG